MKDAVEHTEKEKIVKISKSITVAFVTVVFLFSAMLTCSAVQAIEGSIGVLNMRQVLTGSDAGKKAQAKLEQKAMELQADLKKDEATLLALQADNEKKSSVWNEEKKREKAVEFQRMVRDLKAKQEDAGLELKGMEEKQLTPIRKQLEKVIENMAKEKGLLMILPSEVVMYNADSVDVTAEIVKALNENGKK